MEIALGLAGTSWYLAFSENLKKVERFFFCLQILFFNVEDKSFAEGEWGFIKLKRLR